MVKDNIMFSAYMQSMSAMYQFLFDDDKYTKPAGDEPGDSADFVMTWS